MPPQLSAYHLSNQLGPRAHEPGLFLAASPAFIFKHYQAGDCYLHRVAYQPQHINQHYEDGHHDGVSSFNFDEYLLLDNLTIEASWSLTSQPELETLLDSDFHQDMNSSLMAGHSHFYSALLHSNTDTIIVWLIDKLALSYHNACEYLPGDKLHLAELCEPPFFALHDNELPKQQADDFFFDNWGLALADNNNPAQPDNNHPQQQQTAEHSFRLNWLEIAQGRDYSWGGSGIGFGNISSVDDDALFAIYSAEKTAPHINTRSQMACHALLRQLPWQDYLQAGDTMEVPGAFMVVLMRRGFSRQIKQLLAYPHFSFSRELEFFASRLAVYAHHDLLEVLAQQQQYNPAFPLLQQSYHQACFDKSITLPPTSTTTTTTTTTTKKNHAEILKWQLGHNLSLDEYAGAGYKLAVDHLLKQAQHTQPILNQAIEAAAQFGYTEIVKSLYAQGADLAAGGYWPIKYANKFGYQQLKQYLLNQGQEDKIFS